MRLHVAAVNPAQVLLQHLLQQLRVARAQPLRLNHLQLGRIATATSYEFNETGTAPNGTVLDMLYYATKNLGTSNVDLIEVATSPSSGTLEYIINGGQQKAWFYQNGQWTDISTEFSDILPTIESTAGLYTNMLEGWGGSGSFKYTIPSGQPNAGDTASFTNIQINPSLPDSLFVGPTS